VRLSDDKILLDFVVEEREMKKEEEEQEKEKITTGFLTEMTPAEAMYILNLTSEYVSLMKCVIVCV
jgi:hypothetical protein